MLFSVVYLGGCQCGLLISGAFKKKTNFLGHLDCDALPQWAYFGSRCLMNGIEQVHLGVFLIRSILNHIVVSVINIWSAAQWVISVFGTAGHYRIFCFHFIYNYCYCEGFEKLLPKDLGDEAVFCCQFNQRLFLVDP